MFLCPIPIQSGLFYTGTSGFHKPTLGIYLEWWSHCTGAMQTDKKGGKSLVYQLSGSPLSGSNHCGIIWEGGKKETIALSQFINYWPLFIDINTRYTEAKYKYQAYTLFEVLNILNREGLGEMDYAHRIETEFMNHEIISLRNTVEFLKKDRDKWYIKYQETLTKYNDKKIRQLYTEYETLERRVNQEIEDLKEQKRALRTELKSGRLNNIVYQKKLMPMNKQIRELKNQLSDFRYNRVREWFPDEDVTFSLIEHYMYNLRKKESGD